MKSILNYIATVLHALGTLWKGMKVTAYYFFHHKEIVTQQYPENRATLKMYERYKGEVLMPHTADNKHKCTGCGICEMNCPNGSIEIITLMATMEDGKKKKILDKHIYHLGMCTFCGLCVKTCPSDALVFGNKFEHAVFNRSQLNKVLNQPGSELEAKKPVPTPTPAPAPAATPDPTKDPVS